MIRGVMFAECKGCRDLWREEYVTDGECPDCRWGWPRDRMWEP